MRSPFTPKDLGAFWMELTQAGGDLQARELFRFALEACEAGSHSDEVDQALEWAEELQDRDTESDTYGNFRWYRRNMKPVDRNAVEFSMKAGGLLWIRHRDRMSNQGRERLERLMRFSVEGIRRHTPPVSYTNIWIMKTWNCVALGERLAERELAEEGYAMLARWLQYTVCHGIHEYLSPTYYVASMQPMELIAQYAQSKEGRHQANKALRFFWMQIAANWSDLCARLGGAHSRDYDYLSTGVRAVRIRERFNSIRQGDGEVHPPDAQIGADVNAVLADLPRTVCQRFGEKPEETATTYVGKSFTIGSAGASYGPIDKCLTVNIGGPDTPNATFFTDARGDGYGQRQFRLNSGHSKALHLVPFLTTVQRGSEVLLLAAPAPEGRHYARSAPGPTCLLSHFVLPASADRCSVGDVSLNFGDDSTGLIDVPREEAVIIEWGDVSLAVRAVLARSIDGGEATVQLVRDEEGLACGAMRLTVTHSDVPAESRGVVALWVGVNEAVSVGIRAHFESAVDIREDGDQVRVEIPGWQGPMAVAADLSSYEVLERVGGESKEGSALLMVNGKEIGRALLEC